MKNKFDLIIFDWDGTLINSIDWIVYCVQQAAEDLQCKIPDGEAARDIIGLSLNHAMHKLFPDIDAETQQKLVKSYSVHFFSKPIVRDDLFDGVYEMLVNLKQAGFKLAVATGKSRSGLDRALTGTGTHELFDFTRCADESMSKPNPAMINDIISYLGLANNRALMIGDSIHDLKMAENAAVSSVAVSCGAHTKEVLQKYNPLICLNQTTELFDLI